MPGRIMPNPIIVSMTSSGTNRAEDVHMTWNEIDEIIEKFSFDESDLRDKNALKLLQRLNPLVGKFCNTRRLPAFPPLQEGISHY